MYGGGQANSIEYLFTHKLGLDVYSSICLLTFIYLIVKLKLAVHFLRCEIGSTSYILSSHIEGRLEHLSKCQSKSYRQLY